MLRASELLSKQSFRRVRPHQVGGVKAAVPTRNYNTMIERQSSMPVDGMDTTMFVNLIETMHIEYGMSLP